MKHNRDTLFRLHDVVPYIGTWIETVSMIARVAKALVVPYIGTWIETIGANKRQKRAIVVPYIGTWIETISSVAFLTRKLLSYLI